MDAESVAIAGMSKRLHAAVDQLATQFAEDPNGYAGALLGLAAGICTAFGITADNMCDIIRVSVRAHLAKIGEPS